MEAGLRNAFGITEVRDTVSYAGRTDRAIARELLQVHQIEHSLENQDRLRDSYLANLPKCLETHGGTVCPGIEPLLKQLLGQPGVVLGLLTGNVRRGANHKLSHFALWDFFTCGGFGDEHYERDDVARLAITEVQKHLGRGVDPREVWVIGDTPLDVQCARAVGAHAVAVTTGWHRHEELAAHQPDFLLTDLSNPEELLRVWQ